MQDKGIVRQSRQRQAQSVGHAGESAAAWLLEQKGYTLVARNWRPRGSLQRLELDIIAYDGKTLVFVEVKTRATHQSFSPLASFGKQKQANFVRAGQMFLTENSLWDSPCRFDLVCAIMEPEQEIVLEHYQHVICLGSVMDSGNATWQPW